MPPSDDALAGIVDAAPVGIFAVDADGRMTFWNATAETITGWSRADVLGASTRIGPLLDESMTARVHDELRAGRPFSGKLPGDPSGRLYFRAVPAPGDAIVGVIQDVGDTEAEDEAFAMLDALWEHAPVGLSYFDTDLRYRRVNNAVLAMDGGTRADRLGHRLPELHGPLGRTVAEILETVLETGTPLVDLPASGRLWHGRGARQNWRLSAYPVRDPRDAIVGVGLVTVDVTAVERSRAEVVAVAAERELALGRYQSLVEATSAAAWTRQADGTALVDAPGLRAITGQTTAQYVGWGFLDAVHPSDRARLRAGWRTAVAAASTSMFTCDYRLRTAEAGYRWFRTRAVPVSARGSVVEWVGTESDVHDAIRVRARADVLAAATYALTPRLDPEAEYSAIATAAVPALADMCRVYALDPAALWEKGPVVTGRRVVSVTLVGEPSDAPDDTRFAFPHSHVVARCARSARPLLIDVTRGEADLDSGSAPQRAWAGAVGVNSMAVAPVLAGGAVIAVLLFFSCGDRPRFDVDDLTLVAELGRRTSSAMETALRYQQSRDVSLALQAAMLTEPPDHPGVQVVARYQPAAAGLQVGGDWYDAFTLPGGDLAVGVGDVAGHDLPAAVTMGQLRNMLRALAHDSDALPSQVLRRLDRVVRGLAVTRFATVILGRLTSTAGGARFRWSNGGHPPPLLLHADGRLVSLTRDVDVVLGAAPGLARHDHVVDIPRGATLLLYTDGLYERRHDPDDTATADLRVLAAAGRGLDPDALADHLIAGSRADTGDDIVVLVVRVS